MDQTTNFETQDLPQNITPTPPQKNIFKILFFIFLALFLITISCLVTVLVIKNSTKTSETIKTQEITSTPTIIEEKSNILKISDIQMDLPTGWKVSSVSGNTAKILTDNQISILLETYKTTHNPSYQESAKTPYGEVWSSACVLPLCYGASINTTKYGFNFSVVNDASNLTGEFLDKYNISLETIFNIIKTARPLTEISSTTQDWKTYTDSTYKYSIKYPNNWIFKNNTDIKIVTIETIEHQKARAQLAQPGGYPLLCGYYQIKCYKNISDFTSEYKEAAKTTSLFDFLSNTGHTFFDIKKGNINNFISYEVKEGGMDITKNIFIENNDGQLCRIMFCDQKLTDIENQFLNSFKFN